MQRVCRKLKRPRDCVIRYQIAPNRVLLVSFDDQGVEFEEFRTRPDLVTPELLSRMMDRCRALAGRPLHILH